MCSIVKPEKCKKKIRRTLTYVVCGKYVKTFFFYFVSHMRKHFNFFELILDVCKKKFIIAKALFSIPFIFHPTSLESLKYITNSNKRLHAIFF